MLSMFQTPNLRPAVSAPSPLIATPNGGRDDQTRFRDGSLVGNTAGRTTRGKWTENLNLTEEPETPGQVSLREPQQREHIEPQGAHKMPIPARYLDHNAFVLDGLMKQGDDRGVNQHQ